MSQDMAHDVRCEDQEDVEGDGVVLGEKPTLAVQHVHRASTTSV